MKQIGALYVKSGQIRAAQSSFELPRNLVCGGFWQADSWCELQPLPHQD
jgi:hypothetical protein